ncbi:MAG: hypothetical protein FWC35_01195, partial [Proteobacteria bacterium]|nr:hypothetical protein [Pseudomonadota bacterium]
MMHLSLVKRFCEVSREIKNKSVSLRIIRLVSRRVRRWRRRWWLSHATGTPDPPSAPATDKHGRYARPTGHRNP